MRTIHREDVIEINEAYIVLIDGKRITERQLSEFNVHIDGIRIGADGKFYDIKEHIVYDEAGIQDMINASVGMQRSKGVCAAINGDDATVIVGSDSVFDDNELVGKLRDLTGTIKVIGIANDGLNFEVWSAQELDISALDTSKKKYFTGMFKRFGGKIIFGDMDMSAAEKTCFMFKQATVDSQQIAKLDFSNVTDMEGTFDSATINNGKLVLRNTGKVRNMSYLFAGCNIENLDLESLDTSSCYDMSHMFDFACGDVLDLSGIDTSNVLNMTKMFTQLNVDKIIWGGFNTSNVRFMLGMFEYADVKELDLTCFDTRNVKDMRRMFASCKAVVIKTQDFNTSKVERMDDMFRWCILKMVDVSNFDVSNLLSAKNMFAYVEAAFIKLGDFKVSKECDIENIFHLKRTINTTKIKGGNFRVKREYAMEYKEYKQYMNEDFP